MITLNIFGTEYHFLSFLPTCTICILHYLNNNSLHGRPHKHPSIHKITADTIFLKWHFSIGGILLGRCHTISLDSAAINMGHLALCARRKIYQQCSIKSAITFRISAFHPVSYTWSGDWEVWHWVAISIISCIFSIVYTHSKCFLPTPLMCWVMLNHTRLHLASTANNHVLPVTPNDAKNRATVLWITRS
jgi:hypothetical protein